ncbi:MAG: hypothetical protein ACI86X_001943, partial [Moritella sp.]
MNNRLFSRFDKTHAKTLEKTTLTRPNIVIYPIFISAQQVYFGDYFFALLCRYHVK